MQAFVDQDLCTGCGLCCDSCPAVFEMNEDVAAVIVEEVPAEVEADCREAALGCPVEAITIKD
jgi:ferredoxin